MEIRIRVEIDGNEVLNQTIENPERTTSEGYSQYARFFDENCTGWSKEPEFNLMYLRQQEAYASELLKHRGHLFLNEVYDMLGMPRTKDGQVVGWIYDEVNPIGDNFVDFGIFKTGKTSKHIDGYERSILLDFNVDGNIFDRIK